MLTYFRVFILIVFFTSCGRDVKVSHSYYHWRSVFKMDAKITSKLNGVSELYVKFFDVIWKNDQAIPVSIIHWQVKPKIDIIPVVYITNEVMQKIRLDDIDSLAINIINTVNKLNAIGHELQIDCDWSDTSKDNYFALLNAIGKIINPLTKLSCTIRLHQLKFAKRTGIPPVDCGILMLYNMAALGDHNTVNSIFDPRVIDTYLDDIESYDLPLDLALAKYQQCVLFRNKQIVTTLRNENFFDPSTDDVHFKHDKAWYYTCIKDTTIQNIHIAKDDQIRFEKVNADDGRKYIQKVATINNSDSLKVVYFDIHS